MLIVSKQVTSRRQQLQWKQSIQTNTPENHGRMAYSCMCPVGVQIMQETVAKAGINSLENLDSTAR